MNRSALTIKMLNYLKANDLVSREELADYLETNIRNISEFKKELEVAGYNIESVSGKYGGYRLDEKSIIPTITLNDNEVKAMQDAQNFLVSHEYTFLNDYKNAWMKIKNGLKNPIETNEMIYLSNNSSQTTDMDTLKLIQEAKDKRVVIEMQYCKLSSTRFETRIIQPYECVFTDSGSYVLAYDITPKKEHVFKYFKMSPIRMKDVRITSQSFMRDTDFKLKDYVGQQGLFKDAYHVELEVYGENAKLLAERSLGMNTTKKLIGNTLYLSFTMENKQRIVSYILSLGTSCKIVSPIEIKEAVVSSLKDTLVCYND